jgi:hypothetical protein
MVLFDGVPQYVALSYQMAANQMIRVHTTRVIRRSNEALTRPDTQPPSMKNGVPFALSR